MFRREMGSKRGRLDMYGCKVKVTLRHVVHYPMREG